MKNYIFKRGSLVCDEEWNRIDIRSGLDEYHGRLHCGETMDVLIDGQWIPTHIEKQNDWYLVGIKADPCSVCGSGSKWQNISSEATAKWLRGAKVFVDTSRRNSDNKKWKNKNSMLL